VAGALTRVKPFRPALALPVRRMGL